MAPRKPRSRRDFEVALICALKVEADALQATAILDPCLTLDDRSFDIERSNDVNSYITGTVGDHNVVLLRLARMGKSASSGAVASLHRSFPNIKLTLVIGICGGVPVISNSAGGGEIFLGDLILSTAVIQYDFGRRGPDDFVRKSEVEDNLARTHLKVAGVLNKLETRRQLTIFKHRVSGLQKQIEKELPETTHPGIAQDRLYRADYLHRHRNSCRSCDELDIGLCKSALEASCEELNCETNALVRVPEPAVQLPPREREIRIHFGRVGSGDTIMRSGTHRDSIAARDRLIAFEMEGAGIWDFGPSVVIKGVCDYADAHKNKRWQAHASAVAAAGVKAFLEYWTPEHDGEEETTLQRMTESTTHTKSDTSSLLQNNPMLTRIVDSTKFPTLEDKTAIQALQKVTKYRETFQITESSFVRRPKLIELLDKKLDGISDLKKVITIWGMTGSGKTQLAHSYIRTQVDNKFTACLKVQARSPQELQHCLARYAEQLSLTARINNVTREESIGFDSPGYTDPEEHGSRAMIEWLNLEGNSRWVLLVDDAGIHQSLAEDGEEPLHLVHFIDQLEQGTIILTSQHSAVEELYPGIELKGFDTDESLQLVQLKVGGRKYPLEDHLRLISQLDGHPQALDCAASYMRTYHCGPARYLALWADCDKRIFNYTPVSKGTESLVVTLKLAFEKLDDHAKACLKLCAFLDSTSINVELLQPQIEYERQADSTSSANMIDEAIRQIGDLSLLTTLPRSDEPSAEDTVCMHPAVQKVMQTIALDAGEGVFINNAIRVVAGELTRSSRKEYSPTAPQLIPHVVQCVENLKLLKRYGIELMAETLFSVGRLGQFYHRRGQLHMAVKLYEKALRRYSALGTKTDDYYNIVNSRGLAFRAMGNFKKAQQCFEAVLRYYTSKSKGETGRGVSLTELAVRTNLALCLKSRGQLQNGLAELRNILHQYQQLDPKHPEYYQLYRIKQYIGIIHQENDELEMSESFLTEAYFGLEHIFGEMHAYVLFAKHSLALTYGQYPSQEKRNLGFQELDDARDGILELFGPDSTYALDVARSFAHLKKQNWMFLGSDPDSAAEIIDLYRTVAERHETTVGSSKAVTLNTILDLGSLLYDSEYLDEASRVLRKALTGYKFLKPMPKEGYDASILLARCLWRMGNPQTDQSPLRQALNIFDEARDTIISSELIDSAIGYSLFKTITLDRAPLCIDLVSNEEIRKAMLDVLSLEDITEGQKGWAYAELIRVSPNLEYNVRFGRQN